MPPKWPQLATLLIFSILFVLLLLLLVFVITLQVVLSITTTDFILPPTLIDYRLLIFRRYILLLFSWKVCNEILIANLEIKLCYNFFYVHIKMVFCYQYCSDLLWEKIVLVIEKKFVNLRLKANNLQNFWVH